MDNAFRLPRQGIFADVVEGSNRCRLLREGRWVSRDESSPTIAIHSPTDGSLVGEVPALNREEIDGIFKIAVTAQQQWAETTMAERAELLHRAADLLEENAAAIATVLVQEIAKNRKDSLDEVVRSAQFVHFTAEEGRRLSGEALWGDTFASPNRNKTAITWREPLGVVLAIPPFNYPVNLAVSKIAPALMAGNSVVLKPPTQGAISAIYLVAALQAAGLPPGVLNIATGRGSEIGDYLTTHPMVNMITFTGSSTVGRHLAKQAGMIPLLLELGGKDPAIVLSDAELAATTKEIISGAFSYSGQRCTAMKRVLVTEPIADALAESIAVQAAALSVGRPEDDAYVTPLINSEAADYVQGLIDEALDKGAQLLVGNRREGNLIWPTVIDHVTPDMRLAWEEQFGPVLPIMRVQNAEEAVRLANASEYGLQAAIFTRDLNAAMRIADRLETGTVQINGKSSRGPDHFPFIGTKASGMGAQGVRYSLEAMTRLKSVVINLSNDDPLSDYR